MTRRRIVLLVPVAALVTGIAAQDVVRQPIRQWVTGKVQRADGSPWASAKVTLLSNPWGLPSSGFADEVSVTANDKGLFGALVQPGRTYTAFAVAEVAEGRYTASRPQEGIVVGQPVLLVEDPRPRVSVAVELEGLDAWRERAPLRCTLMVMMADRLEVDLGSPKGGVARIPAVPGTPFFRVVDRDGQPLASGVVYTSEDKRGSLLAGEGGDANDTVMRARAPVETLEIGRTRVRVPPPVPFSLSFRGEGGAGPLEDVEVFWRDRSDMRLIARSGADGIARLRIPRTWGEDAEPVADYLSYWVWAPGHVLGHFYDWKVSVGSGDGPDRELTLLKANSIRGRLLWAPGAPADRVAVLLHSGVPSAGKNPFHRQSASYGGSPTVFWTDAEGRFEVPGRVGTLGWQLSTFLRSDEIGYVKRSRLHPLNPRIVLAAGADTRGVDQELGDILLSRFVPVDIEVVGSGGQPAPRTLVRFREELEELPFLSEEQRVARGHTDFQGRMRILARPDRTLILLVGPEPEGAEEDTAVRIEVDVPESNAETLHVEVEIG